MNKKFKRVWCFGGDEKDTAIDDFVVAYVLNDIRIEVCYLFSNDNIRWYKVNDRCFDLLKDAKKYVLENLVK